MYDHPTPGLKIHRRSMHFDLDPRYVHYLKPPAEDDTIDIERAYHFGGHRVPTGKIARHEFLWRSIPGDLALDTPGKEASLKLAAEYGHMQAGVEIEQIEQLMLAAGDFFDTVLVQDSRASIDDDDYFHNLYDSPIWQESTSVYFQLACKIPYLHQIRSIYSIASFSLVEPIRGGDVAKAIIDFENYLIDRPCPWGLRETIEKGRHYKAKGDDLYQDYGKSDQAVAVYIRAISSILPWFPSDYYMSPWEARACGIGGLLIKCHINLALSLMATWTVLPCAIYMLLETVSKLSCVTNWEMAKIRHLQGRCAKHLQNRDPRAVPEAMKILERDNPIPKYSFLFTQSKIYLDKPPGGFAKAPWIGDFSSRHFRAHLLELRDKLPGLARNKKERWWYSVISHEALRIAKWLRRMQDLSAEHREKMKGEVDGDDLAVDNEKLEASEGKWVWEYRV